MTESNKSIPQIAVIGQGSWATALISILSEGNVKIRWWMRRKEDVNYIKEHGSNNNYLTNVSINRRKVKPRSNIVKVVQDADYVILAVPAAFVKSALDQLPIDAFEGKIVISAIKGMMPDFHIPVTDYIHEYFNVPHHVMGIIAGPCHAEEVALRRQSYLTIGCNDMIIGEKIANLLRCNFVNVTVNPDLIGIEYAAIMKNIIALACGISHGQNMGDNFQAVLVSNAMIEMKRFLDRLFPLQRDLSASAYLGDLLVTCYSQFSRNRTFGSMIGRGYSVKSAIMELKMVAEGYYAVNSIYALISEHKLEMPICTTVYNILYHKISPAIELQLLKEKMA